VVNQPNDSEPSGFRTPRRGYSSVSSEDKNVSSKRADGTDDLELSIIQNDVNNYGTYNEEMLLDDLKVCQPLSWQPLPISSSC
jgi:hypothetical protein